MPRRGQLVRRDSRWEGKTFSGVDIDSAPGSSDIVDSSSLFEVSSNPTITRIRGRLNIGTGVSDLESQNCGAKTWWGIIACHEDRPTQSPYTDIGSDEWMWIGYTQDGYNMTQTWDGTSLTDILFASDSGVSYIDIDVRAQRRCQDDMELRLCWHTVTSGVIAAVDVYGYIRTLILD